MDGKGASARGRTKRKPQRLCIACHEQAGKRTLMRIVRTADGVRYDPTGKASGRGAYIHADRVCWERALDGKRVDSALRTRLSQADRDALHAVANSLAEQIGPSS